MVFMCASCFFILSFFDLTSDLTSGSMFVCEIVII